MPYPLPRSLAACALLLLGCNRSAAAIPTDAGGAALAALGRADAGDGAAPPSTTLTSATLDAGTVDEGALPATSPELVARMKHLLEAITHDNPDLATDLLFPRDAWISAHDSSDPGKVWDTKVLDTFKKHVHLLAKHTKGVEGAQFVAFELGHSVTQSTPKRHEWKRPLWHVKRSKIIFTVDGRTQRIEIGEMVSWRGSWYATRLR